MLIYNKKHVNPLNLNINDIDIQSVAHALSNLCRFTGHCSPHYSVAEHSILVAQLLPEEDKLYGLLHDAHEALIGDLQPELKKAIPEIRVIQNQIQDKINRKYSISGDPLAVKKADDIMLELELDYFFNYRLTSLEKRSNIKIRCESPKVTEYKFLKQFGRLYGKI